MLFPYASYPAGNELVFKLTKNTDSGYVYLVLFEELGEFDGSFDNQLDEVTEGDVAALLLVGDRVVGRGVQFSVK
jgi:hypothetical protein